MRALGLLVALAFAAPAAGQGIAVTHAEAWTMEGDAPVRDATILIEDGRIRSVTSGGGVPAGATVIDARGKPVTPGLVNAATQIGLVEISGSDDTVDTASRDEHMPGYDVSRSLNGNSTLVTLARADGVTGALVYPAPSKHAPFSGEPAMVRLRDGVDILDTANVAVYAVIGGGAWDRLDARGAQWAALREALDEAKRDTSDPAAGKRRKAEGNTRKGGPRGGPRANDGLIRSVVRGEVPLAIQTHRESDIRQVVSLVSDFGIRAVIVGGAEAWRAADALAAAKIAVVLDPLVNLPANFDQLGVRQDNAVILRKAGVPVAFGQAGGGIHTSYNAGLALREGAGIAVANGLPYIDALRAVTSGAMAVWGQKGGTISPGSVADIVVWDGDPLEPSSNALKVIVEGRETPIRSRQDMLAERYMMENDRNARK